jgi:hypothetical protein
MTAAYVSETISYTKIRVPTQHLVSSNPRKYNYDPVLSTSTGIRQFHFADAPLGAHREETCEDT